jgi:ABC-type multidrug transport system fused ATPase/permease subunit
VSRGQRGGSPTVVNLSFLDPIRYVKKSYFDKEEMNMYIGQKNTVLWDVLTTVSMIDVFWDSQNTSLKKWSRSNKISYTNMCKIIVNLKKR